MRYLALDVGTRRTGIAYLDEDVGVPLPLNTINHTSDVFPSALVAVPVFPAISPALSIGNASVRFFRSSGFIFQISSLSGSNYSIWKALS